VGIDLILYLAGLLLILSGLGLVNFLGPDELLPAGLVKRLGRPLARLVLIGLGVLALALLVGINLLVGSIQDALVMLLFTPLVEYVAAHPEFEQQLNEELEPCVQWTQAHLWLILAGGVVAGALLVLLVRRNRSAHKHAL
jgi:ribose/xylose/arabinose/galactoside ABC-type transport system permease subunit